MKNRLFTCLILIASLSAGAQTPEATAPSKGFIGISEGFSIPSGNITKVAYNDNTAGFAGKGSSFGIEGACYFSKYIGIGGKISFTSFNISSTGLDSLSAGYRNSFDVDRVTTSITGAYSIWAFMPGIYLRYPVSGKLSVNANILAGFTSTTTPTIDVAVEDGGVEDGTFTQKACTANAFGYSAGIGVSYQVLSCMAISLHGSYLSCTPDFFVDNINRPSNIGRLVTEYNQPINVMNISLGVAYTFGKK